MNRADAQNTTASSDSPNNVTILAVRTETFGSFDEYRYAPGTGYEFCRRKFSWRGFGGDVLV